MDFQSTLSLSSSSTQKIWGYHVCVFLSYCYDETEPFVEWLSDVLKREGLRTDSYWYIHQSFQVIKGSRIYMVVFSKGYVDNANCLMQLAIIMECMKVREHSFLPIFYGVDPSDVKRWLAPFKTLLNRRQDLVIQRQEDEERVIGKIVAEAKGILAMKKAIFAKDYQSNLSSSLSSETWIWPWRCDAFLSFNTEDTDTCSFVQFLSDALNRNGLITASRDSIARGPLEKYKLYIVVFCKNYATSTCFLQELARIMAAECINSSRHIFLPIFFQVDPSQVLNSLFPVQDEQRKRNSSCFPEHIQELRINLHRVRTLLTQCQDLVIGDNQKDQRRVISKIFDEAIKILELGCYWKDRGQDMRKSFKRIREYGWEEISRLKEINEIAKEIEESGQIATVGIGYDRVEKLEKLLYLGLMDIVRVVGISGMGGVGKTALAREVFSKISHLFDSACFLTYSSENDFGLTDEVILRIALQGEYVHGVDNIESSLRHHRMLIVFDDINKSELSYTNYIRRHCKFGGGSRIIIISRDERVLRKHKVDEIHKVELLNKDEALQLFCKTVFKRRYPMRGYEELTMEALKYADGLPLAIKSLALLLAGRNVSEWQSELAKLQMAPDPSVLKVLKESFDGLAYKEKDIFLDIACCFAGHEMDYVKEILDSQFYDAESAISTFIDKSLINISHQKIGMHYMLQQFGKTIVRRESSEPGERSRIWRYEDFHHIMEKKTGTEHVRVIVLNQKYPQETPLNVEGLSKMNNLEVIIFHNVNFFGDLSYLSDRLTYVSWHKYPFTYWPSSYEPRWLRHFILQHSRITQLWNVKQADFSMLESLNLCGCKNLKETPKFECFFRLKSLHFEGCTSLLRLHPSIVFLGRLKILNLRNCANLASIPNKLFGQRSLQFINLAGCSKFSECLS